MIPAHAPGISPGRDAHSVGPPRPAAMPRPQQQPSRRTGTLAVIDYSGFEVPPPNLHRFARFHPGGTRFGERVTKALRQVPARNRSIEMPITIESSRPHDLIREMYAKPSENPLRVDGPVLLSKPVKYSDPFSRESARRAVVKVMNNEKILEGLGDSVVANAGIANKDINHWDAKPLARALSRRYQSIAEDARRAGCPPKALGAAHAYERLMGATPTLSHELVRTWPEIIAAGELYAAKDEATQWLQAQAAGVIESKIHLPAPCAELVAANLPESDLWNVRRASSAKPAAAQP